MTQLSLTYRTPPGELDLDHDEIELLYALYEMEPWGELRADLRAGLQTQHQYSLALREEIPALGDLMLRFEKEEETPMTEEEKQRTIDGLFSAFSNGGKK